MNTDDIILLAETEKEVRRDSAWLDPEAELSHYIPIDFNHPSLCGLTKDEWKAGTNNWDWVRCPVCLERRAETLLALVALEGEAVR